MVNFFGLKPKENKNNLGFSLIKKQKWKRAIQQKYYKKKLF